jgi:uncharacterized membrane protein
METWLIYAILWSICTGVFWILQKIDAESEMNRNWFIFYAHIWAAVIPLIIILFSAQQFYHDFHLLIFSIFASLAYFFVLKLRLVCLTYMSSSSYFINYRIFVSILLLFWGQLFFSENINVNEYLGVFLWFIVFYLLLEKKIDNKKQTDLWLWYVYLGLSILIASALWMLQKLVALEAFDILTYVFYSGAFWALFSLLFKWKDTLKIVLSATRQKHILFLFLSWASFWAWHCFNLGALEAGWDIAIVYKIISYSLFFPIIFSIIFYKEELTIKRIIAFILTIISIFLFV